MKKIMNLLLAAVMLCTAAGCTGNAADGSSASTSSENNESETVETETETAFEEQVFECDSVTITVTGMSFLTEGQEDAELGRVGIDMEVKNLTDQKLRLPAFTSVSPGTTYVIPGYAMGLQEGDTVVLKSDGTGSFSHTWEIEDVEGNVVDTLSMQISIPKELMDESIAAGYVYEEETIEIPDQVIVEDDWVRITYTDIIYIENEMVPEGEFSGTTVLENISGKALLIASEARQDNDAGQLLKTTDEEEFPASGVTEIQRNGFFVFDPDDTYVPGKDTYGEYVYRRGRYYSINVYTENGELKSEYTMTETSEFVNTQ